MFIFFLAFSSLAHALGRRIAGGLVGQLLNRDIGTHVSRAIQSLMSGSVVIAGVYLYGDLETQWWWGPSAAVLVFLGSTVGFPRCGMVPKDASDVLAISAVHGVGSVGPLALGAAALGLPIGWLIAAALLRGPCYWAATLWQPRIPSLGLNRDGVPDPPTFAELLVGFLLGAAVAATLRM